MPPHVDAEREAKALSEESGGNRARQSGNGIRYQTVVVTIMAVTFVAVTAMAQLWWH